MAGATGFAFEGEGERGDFWWVGEEAAAFFRVCWQHGGGGRVLIWEKVCICDCDRVKLIA